MKDKNKEVTNLQNDSANKSEKSLKDDNMSGCANGLEKEIFDTFDGEVNPDVEQDANDIVEEKKGDDNECASDDGQCKKKHIEPSLEEKYAALNDSHLRLIAEFDNYRKRTIREKADIIRSGGASVLTNLLPVIDDFERAISTMQTNEDLSSAIEGVKLIYEKFISFLSQQGVKVIEAVGKSFETEFFEAVAVIPAPEENMKGKVIDCIQTGYMLYDKVIRHAKVVVGE